MKTLRYIIGQLARALIAALVAVAIMLLTFDWLTGVCDPLSATFVLAFVSCMIGGSVFLWLEQLQPVKK